MCPGSSVYTSVIDNIKRSADLYVDSPTLQDETKTCNGLSVGIGFLAAPIRPVTAVVDEPRVNLDKCGDAGP